MTGTQHIHNSTGGADQHIGDAGVALVALRHAGTAAQIAAAPYVIFFTLSDGEGSMSAASSHEAQTIADALATYGMAHGMRVALRLQDARQAVR